MKHVLYVEDDEKIAREVVNKLEEWNYLVTRLKTVSQTSVIDFSGFQLILLDWNLPDGEGLEIVEQIRSQNISVPILMITAKIDSEDRKKALKCGANDFLGKPFYYHELKSRMDLLLSSEENSISQSAQKIIELEGIRIVKDEMKVYYKDQEIPMKKKEYELLVYFMSRPNAVLSRSEIIDNVWNQGEYPTTRTVDTHILNLRKKLESSMFQTVWSSGYRFVVKEQK